MKKRLFLGNVGSELRSVVLTNIERALNGDSNVFLYNLDSYLSVADNTRIGLYKRGIARLKRLAIENNWKVKEDFIDSLDGMYVSLFESLEELVHVGVDMEKEGYPQALYTRNVEVLDWMYSNGLLKDKGEKKYLDRLTGNRTLKAIKEGKFIAVRLDLDGVKNGVPVYKPTVPTGSLEIGVNKRFAFIPVDFMYMLEDVIGQVFAGKPFKFVKSSVTGQKTHIVTLDANVVRQAYAGCDANEVEGKIRKARIGYDVTQLRFFAHNLEGSLNTLGLASFRPEMLDYLGVVDYTDIDKSQHNINYKYLVGIFKTRIRGLNASQMSGLDILDLNSFATMKDKIEALIEHAEKMPGSELYWVMKKNPGLFGDLDSALAAREKVSPKFLKHMKGYTLPQVEEERIKIVNDMLEKGIVKVTLTKKGGALRETICTNNPLVLSRMLGKGYIKEYESIRGKLYHVRGLIKEGKVNSKQELEKIGVAYNLLSYVDANMFLNDAINSGETKYAIKAIDDVIEELKKKQEGKTQSENLINYRNVYPNNVKDYYKKLNVNNIVSIEFCGVVKKKTK